MKRKNILFCILAITVMLFATTIADAQPRFRRRPHFRPYQPSAAIGIRGGNDFKRDQHLLGGQLWLPMGRFWKFVPSFEYYFLDESKNFDRWQFNGELLFKPHPRAPLYFGGGLAVDYRISDIGGTRTSTGGNAIVGLEFSGSRSSMYPFVQARWTFREKSFFSVIGGINLCLR